MALHPIDYNNFVVYNKHWEYYNAKLEKYGVNAIASYNNLDRYYPRDVAFNISRTNQYYFHKKDCTDLEINSQLKDKSKFIQVKQGYSKCSTLILKKNTVVTSDIGLFNCYKQNGIKVYYIPSGGILLPGYDTGFIGGCGGMVSKNEIVFYGNLDKYEYKEELVKILNEEKIQYYYPLDIEFIDRGSIIGVVGGFYD
nr:hypothetical protein [Lagierella sp.]